MTPDPLATEPRSLSDLLAMAHDAVYAPILLEVEYERMERFLRHHGVRMADEGLDVERLARAITHRWGLIYSEPHPKPLDIARKVAADYAADPRALRESGS